MDTRLKNAIKMENYSIIHGYINLKKLTLNRDILFAAVAKNSRDFLSLVLIDLSDLMNIEKSFPDISTCDPVIFAVKQNYIESFKALLNYPNKINMDAVIDTVISLSRLEMIDELVKHGICKQLLLKKASQASAEVGIFKAIFKHVSPTELKTSFYFNELLLLVANANDHEEIDKLNKTATIEFLLGLEINVTWKNSQGESALHYACMYTSTTVANMLIKKGADINCANNRGNTPLMIAAFTGLDYMVEYFLNNGADLSLINDRGETAVTFCTTLEYFNETGGLNSESPSDALDLDMINIETQRNCLTILNDEIQITEAGYHSLDLSQEVISQLIKVKAEEIATSFNLTAVINQFLSCAPQLSPELIKSRLIPMVENECSKIAAFKTIVKAALTEPSEGKQPNLNSSLKVWGLFEGSNGLALTILPFLAASGSQFFNQQFAKKNSRKLEVSKENLSGKKLKI